MSDKNFPNPTGILKEVLKPLKIQGQFVNKSFWFKLDNELKVEIRLATRGTSGKYECLFVSLFSPQKGLVAKQSFIFVDYLKQSESHPNIKECTHIWGGAYDKEYSWYGPAPTSKSLQDLITEIEMWLSIWK